MDEEDLELGQVRKKPRVEASKGLEVARIVEENFGPFTEAMVLVGSLRRGRPVIADVEFVVLPKDLAQFDRMLRDTGFTTGPKKRNYKSQIRDIPVELYVAHDPREMGSMILMYTGDYLFNIALRSQAKRMGYKLDQYGIWKKKKLVFQSPDEREFFDFLGMDWHSPEERSLARRTELRKAVKALLAKKLPEDDRVDVAAASEILKGRTPLSEELEKRIMEIASRSRIALGSDEMGYGLPPTERTEDRILDMIQELYDRDVGHGGTVLLVDVNMAYNIVQVIAGVLEEGEEKLYLLMEITDLSEESLQELSIDLRPFLEQFVETAYRGEINLSWQGPWRPMTE